MGTDTSDPGPWIIIINPESASGKGKKLWPTIKSQLEQASISFEFRFSENSEGIIQLANNFYKKGYRKFGIVGGDGSLNLLVNGLMLISHSLPDVKLALFPAGTGNDWRKTHQIKNIQDTIRLIQQNKFVHHDVGMINYGQNTSYFINLLGAGLDAEAVRIYHKKTAQWKIGKLKYIAALLIGLISYKKLTLAINLEGEPFFEGKILNLNIGIGKFSGGGIKTIPHAIYNDGLLEGIWISRISLLKIIINLPRLFNGKYISLKEVNQFRGKEIKLRFEQPEWIEADGEMMGPSEEFSINILHKALLILSAS